MNLLNLISREDVKRLGGSVAEMSQMSSGAYVDYFYNDVKRPILLSYYDDSYDDISRSIDDIEAHGLVLVGFTMKKPGIFSFVKRMTDDGIDVTAVLSSLSEYTEVVNELPVSIGIPAMGSSDNGLKRFRAIRDLVDKGNWDVHADHVLWELTNPAELSVYRVLFNGGVINSFKDVFSYRCYIDSYYGIKYDTEIGIFTPPIVDIPDHYMWTSQDILYHLNNEQCRQFSIGNGGNELLQLFTVEGVV